jgi:hypothetical protein
MIFDGIGIGIPKSAAVRFKLATGLEASIDDQALSHGNAQARGAICRNRQRKLALQKPHLTSKKKHRAGALRRCCCATHSLRASLSGRTPKTFKGWVNFGRLYWVNVQCRLTPEGGYERAECNPPREYSAAASFFMRFFPCTWGATCLLADKLSIAFEPTIFDGIIDGIGEMYPINAVTFQPIGRPIDDRVGVTGD